MENILEFNFFKNKKFEKGDILVSRILQIVNDEKLDIIINTGDQSGFGSTSSTYNWDYKVYIDDKIYSFSINDNSVDLPYDITIYSHEYKLIITDPEAFAYRKYIFSKKMWEKIEQTIKSKNNNIIDIKVDTSKIKDKKFQEDLEQLSDVRRSANKYNL